MGLENLKIEFTEREITDWGGISLLKKMVDKMAFESHLDSLPLPLQYSNRGYDPIQTIEQYILLIWCRAQRFEHLDVTRFDPVIQQLFG